MKVVGYARCSTTEQATDGTSLASQEARIRAWTGAVGHEIVAIISDAGVSGKVPPEKRSGFSDALRMLRTGKAQGIVGVALDRFSRTVRDVLDLVESFRVEGWSLISMRESLDTSTAIGRFTVTILAGVSQLERELLGERTAEGLAQRKAEGKRISRFIPWGKTHVEGTKDLVVCESEALITGAVLRMCAEGLGDAAITARLNAEFGEHPRTGIEWDRVNVRVLLRSLQRAGLRTVKKRHRRRTA